jgi:ubiquinone/menaquinone biosynthesis C-methylase UbiE
MNNSSIFEIKFINPEAVLKQLDISKGMQAADFGCGAGYFSLALAKVVAEDGIVFALDILPEKLERVRSQAKNSGINNIVTKRANLELEYGSQLPDKSLDWVIIKDMLYQNVKKEKIIIEAERVLKDDGKILIVEWKTEDVSIGPEKKLRVDKEDLIDLAQKNKLGVFKEIEAGDFHYGIVFIK